MTAAQKNSRKRIRVDDLQIGMYCSDVLNEDGVLILAAHIPISNLEQISILKRLGVSTVEIDLTKGKDFVPAQTPPAQDSETHEKKFQNELPIAKNIYRKTIVSIQNAFKSIKLGKMYPTHEIENAVRDIVESILRNPDTMINICQIRGYNEYVYEHSVNVTILTCALCHVLGHPKETIIQAGTGAFLHDLGMIWIPDAIVNKPDKLTEAESLVIRRHPEYGLKILMDRPGISLLSRKIVIQHHERMNGRGYPNGLAGRQIAETSSIAGIADTYDAMTSGRAHRSALTPQQALAYLYSVSDREFPKKITEHFVKLLGVYPVGSFVRLQSGEMGIVIRVRKEKILSPDVLVLFDVKGRKLDKPSRYQATGDQKPVEKCLNPRDHGVTIADYTKTLAAL